MQLADGKKKRLKKDLLETQMGFSRAVLLIFFMLVKQFLTTRRTLIRTPTSVKPCILALLCEPGGIQTYISIYT